MGEVLSALLVLVTTLVAYATYRLVTVNQGLLKAAKKSADAATAAAESAVKHAELTERGFYLAHRSYVRFRNLTITESASKDALWIDFDVVDAIGVPTCIEEVTAKYWFDGTSQPHAGTSRVYANTEVSGISLSLDA